MGMTPAQASAAGLGWVDENNPNYGKPGFAGYQAPGAVAGAGALLGQSQAAMGGGGDVSVLKSSGVNSPAASSGGDWANASSPQSAGGNVAFGDPNQGLPPGKSGGIVPFGDPNQPLPPGKSGGGGNVAFGDPNQPPPAIGTPHTGSASMPGAAVPPTPSAPKPGADWIPTADGQGWLPANMADSPAAWHPPAAAAPTAPAAPAAGSPAAAPAAAPSQPSAPSAAPDAAPNAENTVMKAWIDQATQGTAVDPNDPNIKQQVDPYAAAQERDRRDYESAAAERLSARGMGDSGQMDQERRYGMERAGQATGQFQSSLIASELANKRSEIQGALDHLGDRVTNDQKNALTQKLADLDAAIKREGIASGEKVSAQDDATKREAIASGERVGNAEIASKNSLGNAANSNDLIRAMLNNQQFNDGQAIDWSKFDWDTSPMNPKNQ